MVRLWISILIGVMAAAWSIWQHLKFLRTEQYPGPAAGPYEIDADELGIAIIAGFTSVPLIAGALSGAAMYFWLLPRLGIV